MVCFLLAAELGFEPRHTESESAVLPLHNSAIALTLVYCSTKKSVCQELFLSFFKVFDKKIGKERTKAEISLAKSRLMCYNSWCKNTF